MKNLLNVILWWAVVVMWVVTIIADILCGIPQWLMIIHAVFGVVCLIAAILSIIRYKKGKG